MKNGYTSFHPIVGILCLILIPILLVYIVGQMASMKADALNRHLGTSYSTMDVIMGVHKTARDLR